MAAKSDPLPSFLGIAVGERFVSPFGQQSLGEVETLLQLGQLMIVVRAQVMTSRKTGCANGHTGVFNVIYDRE